MTNGVGQSGEKLLRSADIGGQRLLGVKSLSNYINHGNSSLENTTQGDTFVSKTIDKTSSFGAKVVNFLGKLPCLIAGGIGIYYVVKTGKIPKAFRCLKNSFVSLGKSIAKIFKKGA